ncbi:bifunctional aspartate transaminase/aspartate 4-decarboxylase [Halanaerobaculum tunisiense]
MTGSQATKGDKIALAPDVTYAEELEYTKLSPFETEDLLEDKAAQACVEISSRDGGCNLLNSGRGNPNFLNTIVRQAFAKLVLFSTEIANEKATAGTLGFRPAKQGISNKLEEYLTKDESKEADFLQDAIAYVQNELQLDQNDFIFELVDAALGDFYPTPPRILPHTRQIVGAYLDDVLLSATNSVADFDFFATEGATEAMVYAFKSLKKSKIISSGDRIATVTPIFSPYLEIPELEDYELINVEIRESEDLNWQIPDEELQKLEDDRIKILYLVNPTNPTSVGISQETIDQIVDLVQTKRQDLIVITDTVYATFVDRFYSLVSQIPENTLCIYSYSKYFGVTGWRLGVIMLHQDNVIDSLLDQLPVAEQVELEERYSIVSTEPDRIKFIDRLEMDSRDVALAHTGGLSCPQQAIMALLSLFDLMDQEKSYKDMITEILDKRIKNLYSAFPEGFSYLKGGQAAHYYTLINIASLAQAEYNEEFAAYLTDNFLALDFIIKLAAEKAIICLPGAGFDGPKWTLRVSLANLYNQDYIAISQAIMDVLENYYNYYQQNR